MTFIFPHHAKIILQKSKNPTFHEYQLWEKALNIYSWQVAIRMNIEHALIEDVLQFLAQEKIFPSPIKFINTNDFSESESLLHQNKNTNKDEYNSSFKWFD